jgi:uncharacterized delta-60 repeat protein
VRPQLETLEDRYLLSGSGVLGAAADRVVATLGMEGVKEIVLPDGKILVGGTAVGHRPSLPEVPLGARYLIPGRIDPRGFYTEIELARFNADGSLDPTFGNDGVVAFQPGNADAFGDFALQPNGDVVVVGTNSQLYGLERLDFGPVVTPFLSLPGAMPGIFPLPFRRYPFWLPVDDDNEFVVARFNANGTLDSSFGQNGSGYQLGTAGFGTAVAVQPDGKIVVAGENGPYFQQASSVVVARYNADGSLDTTFNSGGPMPGLVTTLVDVDAYQPNISVTSVLLQKDGNIVVGVSKAEEAGTNTGSSILVLRYDADGSLDAGFGTGGIVTYTGAPGTSPTLAGVAIEADGTIVAAGNEAGGGLLLVGFNGDGSLDGSFGQGGVVTFDTGSEPGGIVWNKTGGVLLQPDGRIVVAGGGELSGSPSPWLLARFDADGTPDTTFGTGGQVVTAFGTQGAEALAVSLAPDGSLVAAGVVLQPPSTGENPNPLAPPIPGWLGIVDYPANGSAPVAQIPTAPQDVPPPVPDHHHHEHHRRPVFRLPPVWPMEPIWPCPPITLLPVTPPPVLPPLPVSTPPIREVMASATLAPTATPTPIVPPGQERALALADTAFASLATGRGTPAAIAPTPQPVAGGVASHISATPPAVPQSGAAEAQSEAVARLSGGGGGEVVADDLFSLAGDPAGERVLVYGRASDE